MGFSGRNAEVAENELVKHELVQEAEVVLGRHRSVKFLVITNLGLLCMRDIGEEITLWDYTDHVGFEHRLYQILVACSYRNAGHQAFIKKDIVKRLC